MELNSLYTPILADLQAVNAIIRQRLASDVPLINTIGEHIIRSGGKRLRPALLLLAAGAAGYRGEQHWNLAAVIEFIHTATLLHDDVVDGSLLRRGRDTANALWGNPPSVLVGDFLYSRAFEMMVASNNLRVMAILAETTNLIAAGEVQQLMQRRQTQTHEADYLQVIERKTAKLFEAATRLGAVLGGVPVAQEEALACYGLHLGMAYQLIDDVLDYAGDGACIGKNLGDDLAEGNPTLPLLYLLHHGSPAQVKLIRDALETGGREQLPAIQHALAHSDAIAYTRTAALNQATQAHAALDSLPASPCKSALQDLVQFAVERQH
jgi:octaprenyl-diphosphate synthase